MCTYPQLIAAYHVLHSLNEPRHPPYALSYFLYDNPYSFRFTKEKNKGLGTLILSAVFLLVVVKLSIMNIEILSPSSK
jgi:hypothetical protein